MLTDPYRAGERPFAPVFTLNDVLSGIDVTQIHRASATSKPLKPPAADLAADRSSAMGSSCECAWAAICSKTIWTLTAANAETLGKENNEKLGALYRSTREGNPRDLTDEPGMDAFDLDSHEGVEPEGTEA